MFQYCVYTLRDTASLAIYKEIWNKHIYSGSLPKCDIKVHGVWENVEKCQVHALVSYATGDDPKIQEEKYMNSEEFKEDIKEDIKNFDLNSLIHVDSTILTPLESSPLK